MTWEASCKGCGSREFTLTHGSEEGTVYVNCLVCGQLIGNMEPRTTTETLSVEPH